MKMRRCFTDPTIGRTLRSDALGKNASVSPSDVDLPGGFSDLTSRSASLPTVQGPLQGALGNHGIRSKGDQQIDQQIDQLQDLGLETLKAIRHVGQEEKKLDPNTRI